MKKLWVSATLSAAFSISLAVVLIAGCSSAPALTSKSKQVNQVVDDHFEATLKLFPLSASAIGDHRYDDQLTLSMTQEAREQYRKLLTTTYSKMQALGCNDLNEQDTLTCQVLLADLDGEINLDKVDLDYLMPFNQFQSFFSEFAELAAGASYVTFNTEIDYENFLKRIHRIPAYLDATIANMKTGTKLGVTTPRVLVDKALKQLQDLLVNDIKESVFYKPLLSFDQKIKSPASNDLKSRYEAAIKNEIYPAYRKLEEYVRKDYRPSARLTHGIFALPGGRDFYKALARNHTTLDTDPGEIMQLGLSEVARISKQFEEVKAQLKFKGSNKDFFKSLRSNSKLYPFKTSEEVLNAYRAIRERIWKNIPAHFHLLPKAAFEVREVEKFRAENASEAYQNPSEDGTRPGIFWVPIPHADKYGVKSMESLFLHEAIPGHHFQISIQQELTGIPRYRRFEGNNAYVEGWGLYAESLGKELGVYTDPYQWIGRLENEMHRAIRLVVDVGMHWKGWSRERAITYSLENEPGDEAGIISEIERYLAIPGQALAYKMGEQKILQLKALAKERKGTSYSDAAFHDEILKDGPLPLKVLDLKNPQVDPVKVVPTLFLGLT